MSNKWRGHSHKYSKHLSLFYPNINTTESGVGKGEPFARVYHWAHVTAVKNNKCQLKIWICVRVCIYFNEYHNMYFPRKVRTFFRSEPIRKLKNELWKSAQSEFNFSKGKWMEDVLNLFVNKLPFYLYYLIALHSLYFFFLKWRSCVTNLCYLSSSSGMNTVPIFTVQQKFVETFSGNQSESVFVWVLSHVGRSQREL